MSQNPKAKPKNRRTVITRSKNGCITCKIRKVRCDETAPICLRCQKYGIDCDGYAPPRRKSPLPSGPKPLLPKSHSITKLQPLTSALFRQLFRNDQEYLYFNLFCTSTAPQISGHFSTKIWQSLILQASQAEAVIRHAIIALGALITSSSSQLQGTEPLLSRRQFAFQQYHLSISLLRPLLFPLSTTQPIPPSHLRTTLLACLLFSIFETYNGNLSSATTQIYSGCRLLTDWQRSHTHLTTKISSIKSPRPLVIEDELLHAFSELEIEAMCRHDTRSEGLHEAYRYYGQMSIDEMPSSFEDTKEARAYLVLIGLRALHFTSWMKQKSNGALGLRSPEVFERRMKETEEATRRMGLEYDRWERAFDGLWRGGIGVENGVLALRIQLLTAKAWKGAMILRKGVFYGDHTSILEEIVTLAKRVRDNSPGVVFGFEGGLITALRTVGFVFRHRRLKREAMSLLLEIPWKEGLWDSYVVGKALEWLIDLEDEGVDENAEHVPEDKVLREFSMAQDEMRRRTVVTGLQVVQGPDGEEVRRKELIIPWLI